MADLSLRNTILPDTAIAAISNDETIYTYVQLYYAELVESRSTDGVNYSAGRRIPGTSWNTVKPFTPLAATFFGNNTQRYLFYLDRRNVINDLVNEHGKWRPGDLVNLGITTADYSKLAAVTLKDKNTEIIYVFYQSSDIDGGIHQVRGYDGAWRSDTQDYNDPPLLGTSLAAVVPEPGLVIHKGAGGDKIPVVFYQEAKVNDLPLAELQGQDVKEIRPAGLAPSPHTPLAAVDDGEDAFLFYTSDDNKIRRIIIDQDGELVGPLQVVLTTPKGNIASVIFKTILNHTPVETVYVFYQPWYDNVVTEAVSDRKSLSIVSYNLSGSGKSRTWSNPQVRNVILSIE